jgi:hypothetical protein
VAGNPERLGAADVRLAVVDEHGLGGADAQVVQYVLVDLGVRLEQVEFAADVARREEVAERAVPEIAAEVRACVRGPRTQMFCSAVPSMLRRARCRVLETLDPALGGRRQVQPDSPAYLAHAGTCTSRLVSPGEDTPSGTPGHVW